VTADEIIAALGLKPHPEGGHFCETYRDPQTRDGRAASTAIYYLLKRGERSHWHRIDTSEVWHYYAGAPLALSIAKDGEAATRTILGPNLGSGERPQAVVPPMAWQAAESLGGYTLVGCTVAPGFEFAQFEMAPPGWKPG
jgi:hypothetical protein